MVHQTGSALRRLPWSFRLQMIHPKIERGLAGLQVGMFGGVVMVAVLMVVSLLDRRAWWGYPNLLALAFYGARSISGGPGWPTVAGIALQLSIAGCGGLLFGGIFGSLSGSRRIAFFGLLWGVLVFYGSEQLYRGSSPIIAAYMPRSASIVAHMIYGVCLAGIGRIGGAGMHSIGPAGEPAKHGPLVATSVENGPRIAPSPAQVRLELAPRETQIENAANGEPAKGEAE
jgi:hypothetical protein